MKIFKNWLAVLSIALFIVTRYIIWTNPPKEFTQIIYVYMPYAHLWASGELPYLNQWYEYPPLTIPFFYVPHMIDMATNNHWYHVNYSDAYKIILTLVDTGIFFLIWKLLKRLRTDKRVLFVSLSYYSLVTAKAHDFIYDSFDLLFAGAIVLSIAAPYLWKRRGTFFGWFGYIAGIAIKYVNAPLGLPVALAQRFSWKRVIVEGMIATLLTWGLPVAIFRSSLLVTFEYHKLRGLQVESAPATLARTIDQWTHSERFVEIAKAYDIQGPVSDVLLRISKIFFPLSLMAYIGYVSFWVWRRGRVDLSVPLIWITLGYVALFMMTASVLSTPYLLWHIPLIAIIPTKTLKEKLHLVIPSLLIVGVGMTSLPNVPIGPLPLHAWIGWVKIIGFGYILLQVFVYLKSSGTGASGRIN